ncbi:MAG: hypothetical protein U0R71_04040 [Solirubrobacterales bacterium]
MPTSATQPISPEEERSRTPRPVPRVILTREGKRVMCAEIDRLRRRLDGEFTERLREARGFGASHENDDYLQIKEEEVVLASRKRQLEGLLDLTEIVDDESAGRAPEAAVEVELPSGRIASLEVVAVEPAVPMARPSPA